MTVPGKVKSGNSIDKVKSYTQASLTKNPEIGRPLQNVPPQAGRLVRGRSEEGSGFGWAVDRELGTEDGRPRPF